MYCLGQEFATAEPDEQVEVFALDPFDRRFACGFCERGMGNAERRRVAAQAGETLEQLCVRRASEQRGEQCVFLRPRRGDVVGRLLVLPGPAVEVGPQDLASTPVAASTMSTRSAGIRFQFETDGCEIPIWRASSLTPPTARTASSRPGSRIKCLIQMISM